MGSTNEQYAKGHRDCAAGKPLSLGIRGWTKERSDYAEGWLACFSEIGGTLLETAPVSANKDALL